MARAAYDRGAVDASTPADRMLLLLGPSAQQSASLETFLATLQDSTSPQYHHFLSPSQFASQFGPSDADVQSVTTWLQAQGFHVERVTSGRQAVEFSGTAGQIRQAFSTEIHKYVVGGEEHYANATPPEIPGKLAPLVKGVLLSNFGPRPQVHTKGTARMDRQSHQVRPLFNDPLQQFDCLSGYCFGVTPGDFAKIYNTAPLLASGIDGTGVTIGIVGIAPMDLPSVQAYRENFLPAYSATNLPTPVLEGVEPTVYSGGALYETQLDVEEAGGVAPNAKINYYYGADSYTTNGLDLALLRAIDDNQISILSISFGACESDWGNTYNTWINNLYQQAAAQGITVVVASGDSGSATCDPPPNSSGYTQASRGLAVSAMASTPYNIAVGGTDFLYPQNATLTTLGTYWNVASATSPNNNPDWSSAMGYIPEKPWNFSDPALNQFHNGNYNQLEAGGGGPSSCSVSTGGTPNVCISGYPKPSWQMGFGQDTVRDVPDVSFFASYEGNYSFTPVCLQGQCIPSGGPNSTTSSIVFQQVGGTSVSAPSFAGILALVVQKQGTRLGQANPVLYALAKQQPSIFHDITVGTNRVQCVPGSVDCGSDGYLPGYSAGPGYDLATGLGSLDATALVNHWADVATQNTTTMLTITPATTVHGTAQTFTANVTGGPTSGNIGILTTAKGADLQGQYSTVCTAFPCTFTYSGMPGGSYNVAARFAGDATHSASTSANVAVDITPEPSELGVYYQLGPGTPNAVRNLDGGTFPYGAALQYSIVPLPIGPLPVDPFLLPSPASGSVTVLDNGTPLGTTWTLNTMGLVSLSLNDLAVGQHTLITQYSGDASYQPSTTSSPVATPMSFTIVKSQPSIYLVPNAVAVTPGTPVTLVAHVEANNLAAVQGSMAVQLTSSGGTITLPSVTPAYEPIYMSEKLATITVPASDLVAGTNTLSVTYPGSSNLLPATGTATIQVIPPNTTLTLSTYPATPIAGTTMQAIATLTWQQVPAGAYGFYGTISMTLDGKPLCGTTYSGPPSGSFDNRCYIDNIQPGPHTLGATYPGDSVNTPASASLTFTVAGTVTAPLLDFEVTATSVVLPRKTSNPSGASTVTLNLATAATAAATFTLSCSTAGSPAGMTCNVPSSLTIAAGVTQATTSATIAFNGTTAALQPKPGSMQTLVWLGALPAFWLLRRKRLQTIAALCLLLVMTLGLGACGSGGVLPGTIGKTPPATGPLQPGSYGVTISAKNGTTTQQANILIRVQ